MSKTLQTRVQMKHDTEANWNKATNFVPLAGEIIIYDADDSNSTQRIKIGNGTDILSNLPFVYLPLSGGTMNGSINMGGQQITNISAPFDDTDAATKNYVDERIYVGTDAPADTSKLWIDTDDDSSNGGNSGSSGSIIDNVLLLSGGTMNGSIDMNNNSIINLPDPTNSQDAATKNYVDNAVATNSGSGSGGLTQVYSAGTTAPTNTNLLWIDTNSTTGGLKYYNGTSWVHVPVAYV